MREGGHDGRRITAKVQLMVHEENGTQATWFVFVIFLTWTNKLKTDQHIDVSCTVANLHIFPNCETVEHSNH